MVTEKTVVIGLLVFGQDLMTTIIGLKREGHSDKNGLQHASQTYYRKVNKVKEIKFSRNKCHNFTLGNFTHLYHNNICTQPTGKRNVSVQKSSQLFIKCTILNI